MGFSTRGLELVWIFWIVRVSGHEHEMDKSMDRAV